MLGSGPILTTTKYFKIQANTYKRISEWHGIRLLISEMYICFKEEIVNFQPSPAVFVTALPGNQRCLITLSSSCMQRPRQPGKLLSEGFESLLDRPSIYAIILFQIPLA